MSWLSDVLHNLAGVGPRQSGPPPSPNGASSFHLAWQWPGAATQHFAEVSVVLEVLVPPRVQRLYFWALQIDFVHDGATVGGGHTGLQWNQRYPEGRAVNWGGYASQDRGGQVLPGTTSTLEGFADDPNTLSYGWQARRPYRLRVYRSPDIAGAWRAEVTDVESGDTAVIRDLTPDTAGRPLDTHLARPIVWSEVFADCDAPSVSVRWSELQAKDDQGREIRPAAVLTNYQSRQEGGCSNTTMQVDEQGGILQITNTPRLVTQGSRLALAGPPEQGARNV